MLQVVLQMGVTLGFVHGAKGYEDWGPPPEDDESGRQVERLRSAAAQAGAGEEAVVANVHEQRAIRSAWSRRWMVAMAAAALVSPVASAGAPGVARAATQAPEFVTPWTARVTEYTTPNDRSWPEGIANGPDGNVWFTGGPSFFHKIDKITPSGVITEINLPDGTSSDAVTAGPKTDPTSVWFTDGQQGMVGRVDTKTDAVRMFPAPGFGGFYQGIAAGPDGNLWVTGYGGIGRINPANGKIISFPVVGATPGDITAGPDGNLWFTDINGSQVGRIDTSGHVTLFPVPGHAGTNGIVAGPDGNMWFVSADDNTVGRISLDGRAVAIFPLPTPSALPWRIGVGPDGNLWFTELSSSRVGRVIPSTGSITEVHLPPGGDGRGNAFDVVTGPDGKLWFTRYDPGGHGAIDTFSPKTLRPPPGPCLTVTHDLTLDHDIGPCAGDGVLVTASDITVNLNGHRVVAGPGPRYGDFAGVHLLGVHGVTVTGGTGRGPGGEVSRFDAGVFIDFGSANTVEHVNIHDNLDGGEVSSNLGDGIAVIHSAGNRIHDDQVVHNGLFDGIAFLGIGSSHNRIEHNTVRANTDLRRGQGADGLGIGIISNAFLEQDDPRRGESLTANDILDNTVTDNVSAGISNLSNVNATIRGNQVTHNGWRPNGDVGNYPGNGIGVQHLLTSTPNTRDTVEGNHVEGNSADGIAVLSNGNIATGNVASSNGANGIDVEGHRNQIVDNVSTDNDTEGFAFDLFDGSEFGSGCDANTWSANVWGSAGYSPACTAAGGSGPPNPGSPPEATAKPGTTPTANRPLVSSRGRAFPVP